MIEHVNGRRFLTPEQRQAMGWPAEIPKKNFRLKGKGAALEAVGGAVPASDSATRGAGRDGGGGEMEEEQTQTAVLDWMAPPEEGSKKKVL